MPVGRKNYTKTSPLQYKEFEPCLDWWGNRTENERAWKISVAELLAANCNLDRKNPHANMDFEHMPPGTLAEEILNKERQIVQLVEDVITHLESNQ
jgi:type I restriction enzyme M protein